jgi:ion channel-forming bestrophin family protein
VYVRKLVSPKIVWYFSRVPLLVFTALSTFAYFAYVYGKLKFFAIPFLPVATVGTAVAFYVGFKNNASYERLWEARKIWSEIEHLCRYWAIILTQARVKDAQGIEQNLSLSRRLVYQQLAWVNSLRIELRNEFTFADVDDNADHVKLVSTLKHDEQEELRKIVSDCAVDIELPETSNQNISLMLLAKQVNDLNNLKVQGLSDGDYGRLVGIVAECSKQQSAAQRINRFPFPRQYAHFSAVFVNIFIALLPFSLVNELAKNDPGMLWLTVPMSVLLSWVFYTMEKVGDTSENPFENGLNDVPLTSICRDIEIEMKALLCESELPERMQPKDGVLL